MKTYRASGLLLAILALSASLTFASPASESDRGTYEAMLDTGNVSDLAPVASINAAPDTQVIYIAAHAVEAAVVMLSVEPGDIALIDSPEFVVITSRAVASVIATGAC